MAPGVRTGTILSLGLLLAVMLLPVNTPPASAGSGLIRPGDALNGGTCTLNFIFDGPGGEVYIGTAAHCVSSGQTVSTTQYSNFGTVVLDDETSDFALIRVHSAREGDVDPRVKGWPDTPTGVTTSSETSIGDITLHTGYGIGFAFTPLTRETRVGSLFSDSYTTYRLNGPNVNGDSGAPIVHEATGKALGIISQYGIGIPPTTDQGPTIEWILDRAAALGHPITLRTV